MTDSEKRAILRIGNALRLNWARRLRLHRRGAAVAGLIGMLGLTMVAPLRPLLVWNASASPPVGLYAVFAPHDLQTGDRVIARLPAAWRARADARGYLPTAVPVVMRVPPMRCGRTRPRHLSATLPSTRRPEPG